MGSCAEAVPSPAADTAVSLGQQLSSAGTELTEDGLRVSTAEAAIGAPPTPPRETRSPAPLPPAPLLGPGSRPPAPSPGPTASWPLPLGVGCLGVAGSQSPRRGVSSRPQPGGLENRTLNGRKGAGRGCHSRVEGLGGRCSWSPSAGAGIIQHRQRQGGGAPLWLSMLQPQPVVPASH